MYFFQENTNVLCFLWQNHVPNNKSEKKNDKRDTILHSWKNSSRTRKQLKAKAESYITFKIVLQHYSELVKKKTKYTCVATDSFPLAPMPMKSRRP